MLIAARNGFAVGGWKNPYVTDGLVAMWDGEWNTGGGKHDASATTWTEIVSNTKQNIGNGNLFNDNSLVITNTTGVYLPTKDLINNNAGFSIECVGYTRDASSTILLSGLQGGEYTVWAYWTSGTSMVTAFGNYSYGWINGYLPSHALSSAITYDGTKGAVYFPSVNIKQSYVYTFTSSQTQDIQVGGGNKNLYSIRLYSRALTADEIAANYAIDKERFKLP